MQIVNTMLDFGGFVFKNIINIDNTDSAFGLFNNAKTVSKVIKYAAAFKFSSPEFEKIKEHLDIFSRTYCSFVAVPIFRKKAGEANAFFFPSKKEAGKQEAGKQEDGVSVLLEGVVKIGYLVKSVFDLTSCVTNYFDPYGLAKSTPLKYINGGLDIFDDVVEVGESISKLWESLSSQDLVDASHQTERKADQMKMIKQGWAAAKNITSLALSIIGLLVLTTSLTIPFYVVPVVGLASVAFGLFSKYVAVFEQNPTKLWACA